MGCPHFKVRGDGLSASSSSPSALRQSPTPHLSSLKTTSSCGLDRSPQHLAAAIDAHQTRPRRIATTGYDDERRWACVSEVDEGQRQDERLGRRGSGTRAEQAGPGHQRAGVVTARDVVQGRGGNGCGRRWRRDVERHGEGKSERRSAQTTGDSGEAGWRRGGDGSGAQTQHAGGDEAGQRRRTVDGGGGVARGGGRSSDEGRLPAGGDDDMGKAAAGAASVEDNIGGEAEASTYLVLTTSCR